MSAIFTPRILSYACTSSAGNTTEDFWESLTHKKIITDGKWKSVKNDTAPTSSLECLTIELVKAWKQAQAGLTKNGIELKNFGIILASTKGCIDDFVWDSSSTMEHDSISPVLKNFILRAELCNAQGEKEVPLLALSISNACASSISAFQLGSEWLRQGRVEQVIIIAADLKGKFVQHGFQSLKALTPTFPKPFAESRDGLSLGEAAAAIVLAAPTEKNKKIGFQLLGVGLDTEGYAVTRPSPSGESLKRAYLRMSENKDSLPPDLIIAHGTGTQLNDSAEDKTYAELFNENKIPITGTKWCVGHTLASSGAMDIIAACEILRHQKIFTLATTAQVDPTFKGNYVTESFEPYPIKKILVSSLGFGGVHAVAEVGL